MEKKSTSVLKFLRVTRAKAVLLASFMLVISMAKSQIAAYNVFGSTNYGESPLAATTANANNDVGPLTRGIGVVTTGTADANGWGGIGFSYSTSAAAIAANAYISFVVAPKALYATSFSTLTGFYRRASNGPTSLLLQYSVDGLPFVNVSTIAINSTVTTGEPFSFTLSSTPILTYIAYPSFVTFRLVPYGAGGVGNFYFYSNTSTTNALVLNATTILPVTLTNFTAIKSNNNIALSWNVASEQNFSHYEVERSANGTEFSTLGQVAAGRTGYSYMDVSPLKGIGFYRLKLVDKDGKFTYSKIVKVDIGKTGSLSIFPNPAKSIVSVSHPAATAGAMIRVSSLEGKTVLQQNVATNYLQSQLFVGNLAKGQYLVEYISDGKKVISKLIKE